VQFPFELLSPVNGISIETHCEGTINAAGTIKLISLSSSIGPPVKHLYRLHH
jgi:hypothetical protein